MSFTNIDEYNELLKLQESARYRRKPQPEGLAIYQARKAKAEAEKLAPYSVVKDAYYSTAPWHVRYDGKNLCEFFETKKAAIEWIMKQKNAEK